MEGATTTTYIEHVVRKDGLRGYAVFHDDHMC